MPTPLFCFVMWYALVAHYAVSILNRFFNGLITIIEMKILITKITIIDKWRVIILIPSGRWIFWIVLKMCVFALSHLVASNKLMRRFRLAVLCVFVYFFCEWSNLCFRGNVFFVVATIIIRVGLNVFCIFLFFSFFFCMDRVLFSLFFSQQFHCVILTYMRWY